MSRYISFAIILALSFTLVSCSKVQSPKVFESGIGKKSFAKEDQLILEALELKRLGKYQDALQAFEYLYKKSNKVHYTQEAAKLAFLSQNIPLTKTLIQKGLSQEPNNIELRRILVGIFAHTKDYESAQNEIQKLLDLDKSARHLLIAGNVYLQVQKYDLALKYFESAYNIDTSDDALLNIVDILYNYMQRKDDAVAYLETHIRLNLCEAKTCFKLIEIYGKEQNIDGIIATYEKLFSRFGHEEYGKKVIELYMYKKDKKSAVDFLKNSGYNKKMLLDIYLSDNDFKNAYRVAEELYKQTDDLDYLGKMAIYEYEQNRTNMVQSVLDSVAEKFEIVVSKLQQPIYLNYYGYLLIDHDMDIQKGINLVKEALMREPNSVYYLDSLAWGYYKAGKCEKALEIIEKLVSDTQEQEVMMHYEKIQQCLKESK